MSLHFLARDLGIWDVRALARQMSRSQFLDWVATYEIEGEMIKRAEREANRAVRGSGA